MNNEKVELYLPLVFWSQLLMTLDRKTETIVKEFGYGKVHMTITVQKGKVIDVIYSDEIHVRHLVEQAQRIEDKM